MTKPLKQRTISNKLTGAQWKKEINVWPTRIVGQNSKLKKTNFFQWSIPAYMAEVVRGGKLTRMKTCPCAGDCSGLCYACQGTFMFSGSMLAHTRNLQAYLNDNVRLAMDIVEKIQGKRKIRAFRVHDSGDFFNAIYARWWFAIMRELPNVQFYAYTKMVSMFKNTLADELPDNLTIIYSFGGTEDHLIDTEKDRHSKVFSSKADMLEAGYADTTKTDEKASRPEYLKIGLVYHGVLGVDKAMAEADMGQKDVA